LTSDLGGAEAPRGAGRGARSVAFLALDESTLELLLKSESLQAPAPPRARSRAARPRGPCRALRWRQRRGLGAQKRAPSPLRRVRLVQGEGRGVSD
jgi:hypothetical protein